MWACIADLAIPAITQIANEMVNKEKMLESFRDIVISVLLKVPNVIFSTHLFRPISLLNTDYKIIMRVWANRLGPILNDIIKPHQKGFIPGRDGRENILALQFLMDINNHKRGGKGAVLFLDLKKAFDKVSHEALITNRLRD